MWETCPGICLTRELLWCFLRAVLPQNRAVMLDNAMETMCIFWLLWWKRPIKTEMDPLWLHCGTTLLFCAQIRLGLSRWQKWSIYEATVGVNITNSIVSKQIHKVCVLNFFVVKFDTVFLFHGTLRDKNIFPCCHVLTVRSDKKYKQKRRVCISDHFQNCWSICLLRSQNVLNKMKHRTSIQQLITFCGDLVSLIRHLMFLPVGIGRERILGHLIFCK